MDVDERRRRDGCACYAGKGNNGGDGFVVARYLKEEADRVEVYLLARPEELRGDAAKNLALAGGRAEKSVVVTTEAEWEKAWPDRSLTADVIVDALLGTGIRGAAIGLIAQAIEDVNRLSRNATRRGRLGAGRGYAVRIAVRWRGGTRARSCARI